MQFRLSAGKVHSTATIDCIEIKYHRKECCFTDTLTLHTSILLEASIHVTSVHEIMQIVVLYPVYFITRRGRPVALAFGYLFHGFRIEFWP